MIRIIKHNEKSAKIENEKERAISGIMSVMMVTLVLLPSILFHYFSVDTSEYCVKKMNCIECSMCKYFCSC